MFGLLSPGIAHVATIPIPLFSGIGYVSVLLGFPHV